MRRKEMASSGENEKGEVHPETNGEITLAFFVRKNCLILLSEIIRFDCFNLSNPELNSEVQMQMKWFLTIALIAGIVGTGCSKKKAQEQLLAEAQQYEAQEDVENALNVYEELSHRFPQSPHADSILQKLGMIYLNHKEQYQRAIDAYERLIKKYPESKYQAQSLFMVGYIYANHLKDYEHAKESYNKFLDKYPQHELVTSVKWELEHLGKDISDIDIFADSKEEQETKSSTDTPAEATAKSGPKAKH
jgi:tetratricopeptide (TPR) repeat protein